MAYKVVRNDVIEWAENYTGKPFHALIGDPPYEYGFMGKSWDSQGVSFQPETWKAIARHLMPGGFGAVFAGARTHHRIAVAIEDAGLTIHPQVFAWVYSSGFPKATRIDRKIDGGTTGFAEAWAGHRYGLQALKPAVEPIIVFQKPYDGKPITCMTECGAGALWIDGARIGAGDDLAMPSIGRQDNQVYGAGLKQDVQDNQTGRWPANFALVHHPECRKVGAEQGKGYQINRFTDWAKPFGGGAGHEYETDAKEEMVAVWDCHPDCPARKLSEQAGLRKSGKPAGVKKAGNNVYGKFNTGIPITGYGDSGTAARFFHNADWAGDVEEGLWDADPVYYCPKASRKERNAGLEKNPHPTVKPISLNRWLATLLLPPALYAPRRLMVPFSGSGSEMIGAMQAGWEYIEGIELDAEYVEIAERRLTYWSDR